jgi:hypothetical protein
VSMSLGLPAIFLVGGPTKATAPAAIRVRRFASCRSLLPEHGTCNSADKNSSDLDAIAA